MAEGGQRNKEGETQKRRTADSEETGGWDGEQRDANKERETLRQR